MWRVNILGAITKVFFNVKRSTHSQYIKLVCCLARFPEFSFLTFDYCFYLLISIIDLLLLIISILILLHIILLIILRLRIWKYMNTLIYCRCRVVRRIYHSSNYRPRRSIIEHIYPIFGAFDILLCRGVSPCCFWRIIA